MYKKKNIYMQEIERNKEKNMIQVYIIMPMFVPYTLMIVSCIMFYKELKQRGQTHYRAHTNCSFAKGGAPF